jgi:Na+/H+-dicarboxylate symporter
MIKLELWHKVLLGLILGIICGILFPEFIVKFKIIGDIFLKLIKMVIPPLIFFTLVSGITSMGDPDALGRVGLKAALAFVCTTLFATIFGLSMGLILKPGVGTTLDLGQVSSNVASKDFNIIQFLVNIIPSNPIAPMVEGNVLQIVFLAIFTGITVSRMGSSAAQIKKFCHVMSKVVMKMISSIILLSPYAAFALVSWVVATQGTYILFALSKLIFAVVLAMLFQYMAFGLMILIFARISPLPFYRKSFEYQIMAFSTSSSKATLATTMDICENKLGISGTSTSFVLPLGASINMDGFAINLSLTAIFFAQLLGVDLSLHDYFVIVLTSTLGSIGGAGIPGASLIMMPMVLSSVGMPIEGVAILAGIDRVLDMLRTTINITGDATITLLIDSSEGNLDLERYYSK